MSLIELVLRLLIFSFVSLMALGAPMTFMREFNDQFRKNEDEVPVKEDPNDPTSHDFSLMYNFYFSGDRNVSAVFVQVAGAQMMIGGLWNDASLDASGDPVRAFEQLFAKQIMLLIELAKQHNALVAHVEHRYFGRSRPAAKDTFQRYDKAKHLSPENVVRDVQKVLAELRSVAYFPSIDDQRVPIVAIGAGYSGLLAKWLQDAGVATHVIASSTPFSGFVPTEAQPTSDGDSYSRQLRTIYGNCLRYPQSISAVFRAIDTAQEKKDYFALNRAFHIAKHDELHANDADVDEKIEDLRLSWKLFLEAMSAVNFAYPPSHNLRGSPVQRICAVLNGMNETHIFRTNDAYDEVLAMVRGAYASVFKTGDEPLARCHFQTPNCVREPEQQARAFLQCTALQEFKDFRLRDQYEPTLRAPALEAWLRRQCRRTLPGVFGDGGDETISLATMANKHQFFANNLSNIVISIPQMATVRKTIDVAQTNADRGVFVMHIPNASNGQDLREPNTCDPEAVTEARIRLSKVLDCWIAGGGAQSDECQRAANAFDANLPDGFASRPHSSGYLSSFFNPSTTTTSDASANKGYIDDDVLQCRWTNVSVGIGFTTIIVAGGVLVLAFIIVLNIIICMRCVRRKNDSVTYKLRTPA